MKNKSHFRQEFYYFSIKAENNLKMMLVAKFGNEEQLRKFMKPDSRKSTIIENEIKSKLEYNYSTYFY